MRLSFEKATGGGAYKFADLFRERLGVSLDKEDEMDCLVAGANFLLKVNILNLLNYTNNFNFIYHISFKLILSRQFVMKPLLTWRVRKNLCKSITMICFLISLLI